MATNREFEITTRDELKKCMGTLPHFILKASATWCKPCKRSAPIVMGFFNKLPDNVIMIHVDIDKGDDVAAFLKIRSVPFMQSYVKGEPMHSCVSSKEEDIRKFFMNVTKATMK